jgi:hypothetical protein
MRAERSENLPVSHFTPFCFAQLRNPGGQLDGDMSPSDIPASHVFSALAGSLRATRHPLGAVNPLLVRGLICDPRDVLLPGPAREEKVTCPREGE